MKASTQCSQIYLSYPPPTRHRNSILETSVRSVTERSLSVTRGGWWGEEITQTGAFVPNKRWKLIRDYIRRQYQNYLLDIAGRSIWLQNIENPRKHMFLKYDFRGSEAWREKTMRSIPDSAFFRGGRMITLTIDPKKTYSFFDACNTIKKEWHRLHTALREKYGKFDYICVTEWTKNGLPHLHVLTTLKQKTDLVWLRREWENVGSQIKVSYVRDVKIADYIKKYVMKGAKDPYFWPLFWISGLRFMTRTQSLRKAQKRLRSGKKSWICHGSINESFINTMMTFNEQEQIDFLERHGGEKT